MSAKCTICGEPGKLQGGIYFCCDWCWTSINIEIIRLAHDDPSVAVLKDKDGVWDQFTWYQHPTVAKRQTDVIKARIAAGVGVIGNLVTNPILWVDDRVDTKLETTLDEVAQSIKSKYPHTCPYCGQPAYVGLSEFDCSVRCQENRTSLANN